MKMSHWRRTGLRLTGGKKKAKGHPGLKITSKVMMGVQGHTRVKGWGCMKLYPHRRLSFHAIPSDTQGGALPVLGCRFQLSSEEAGRIKWDSKLYRSWLAEVVACDLWGEALLWVSLHTELLPQVSLLSWRKGRATSSTWEKGGGGGEIWLIHRRERTSFEKEIFDQWDEEESSSPPHIPAAL